MGDQWFHDTGRDPTYDPWVSLKLHRAGSPRLHTGLYLRVLSTLCRGRPGSRHGLTGVSGRDRVTRSGRARRKGISGPPKDPYTAWAAGRRDRNRIHPRRRGTGVSPANRSVPPGESRPWYGRRESVLTEVP